MGGRRKTERISRKIEERGQIEWRERRKREEREREMADRVEGEKYEWGGGEIEWTFLNGYQNWIRTHKN